MGLITVIAVGFALSFDAIRTVGYAAAVRDDLAWLLPATVDGTMAVAAIAAVVMRRLGHSVVYAWAVMLVNAAISIGCNGSAAGDPTRHRYRPRCGSTSHPRHC